MSKYKKIINSKQIRQVVDKIVDDRIDIVYEYIERNCELMAMGMLLARVKSLVDIIHNNEKDYLALHEQYIRSPTSIESKRIRYGDAYADDFRSKLKRRPKIDRSKQNKYDPVFVSKVHNINIETAEKIVADRKNSARASAFKTHSKLKQSGYSYRENNKLCIEYWIKRGYNEKDAGIERNNSITASRTNLAAFTARYGQQKGEERFKQWNEKRKRTYLERCGTTTPTSGKTSKESLRFFIKLYRKVRRLGISKDDIYWGISGSKEFASHDSNIGNMFFDFTIKSLKFIIEYQGSAWHVHPERDYIGFLDPDLLLERDFNKRKHIEGRGFEVNYVWDFEDHGAVICLLVEKIQRRLDGCR